MSIFIFNIFLLHVCATSFPRGQPCFMNSEPRGVIGEVRCGFLWIYTPTPYSAVFLLHAPTPAPIKIGFGAVRCGAM